MKRPQIPGQPASPPRDSAPIISSRRQESSAHRHPRRTKATRDETATARAALRDARKARKAFERNEVRRFTARLRRRRQAWLAAIVSVVGLVTFVVVGVFSPAMRVESISVTGSVRVDPTAIISQLNDQVGVPLPLIDVSRVESVLRKQNLIESYSIESRPPHDLIIHIVERTPIAFIPANGVFLLKDAAGVTIETVPEFPGGFPLLTVPNAEAKGVAFEAAVAVLRTIPLELRERISEISATTADDVTFVLGDTGQRVFWGSADDASVKARALVDLLANWPPGTANEYDVSSKDNVVVR